VYVLVDVVWVYHGGVDARVQQLGLNLAHAVGRLKRPPPFVYLELRRKEERVELLR